MVSPVMNGSWHTNARGAPLRGHSLTVDSPYTHIYERREQRAAIISLAANAAAALISMCVRSQSLRMKSAFFFSMSGPIKEFIFVVQTKEKEKRLW